MIFVQRLSLLFRANSNDWVGETEDPGKILGQSMADMQEILQCLKIYFSDTF
tara:strand:+ start:997 stop:1152 length:156 start_codon:yes stop_codon:yes gene_type:complete